eukprot:TRINITY_DN1557_c0_g3_i1.p2 TRINITY_DN1557_c0_g3~~TRINITY_DN1557_c0_g3_i1.p2  ORF type:complete len:107 (-),score=0.41 TRINITY_DN1557_c0_g3_i1:126-446(-)
MPSYGFPYMTLGSTPSTPFVAGSRSMCPYIPSIQHGSPVVFPGGIGLDFGSAYQNAIAQLVALGAGEQLVTSPLAFHPSVPTPKPFPNFRQLVKYLLPFAINIITN